MTLRAKIVALVLGLTTCVLAGLGLFLAGSWSRWSRETVGRDLADRADAVAALVEVKEHGALEIEDEGSALLSDAAHPYRIVGPGGFEVSTGELDWPAPSGDGDAVVSGRGGRAWRVVSRTVAAGEHGERERAEREREGLVTITVQVAGLDAPFGGLEERFRHGLLVALLAALVLGGGGAALLAHLALAPLRRLTTEVNAIGATSLDRRVSAAGLDPELGRLAAAFNDLLGRLDEAMTRQRAFVARASHALRTPIATMLTRAEVALRRDRGAAEYRDALADVAVAARDSAGLVRHLLALARLDERRRPLELEEVAVDEFARDLARIFGPRADEAGIALDVDVPAGVCVTAERAALRELLDALLDNALQYTPRGGRAGVRAAAVPEGVAITVWDTGPGIPPAERARAFDRFRRGSAAQSSGKPGSGLGLAIVKAIADAHGATVTLEERPGGGVMVVVTMPRRDQWQVGVTRNVESPVR